MIKVYTDGASQGNPGKSGAGIFIKADNKTYEYSIPLPVMSNHEAEFHAVIKALEISQQSFPTRIISLRSDAQVVVEAINKGYTNNTTFQPLLKEAKSIITTFTLFFIKWIPQNHNKRADQLAKQAIYK